MFGADGYAYGDVMQAGEATPNDHVAGRRVAAAGEVAAEHGDLQEVVGKYSSTQPRFWACRVDAVERVDLSGGEDGVGWCIGFDAGRHGEKEDAPADHRHEGEELRQPLGGLQPALLGAAA